MEYLDSVSHDKLKIKGPLFIFCDVMHRRVVPVSLSCVGRGSIFYALAVVGYNHGKLVSWSGPPVALSGRRRRVIVAVSCQLSDPGERRQRPDHAPATADNGRGRQGHANHDTIESRRCADKIWSGLIGASFYHRPKN